MYLNEPEYTQRNAELQQALSGLRTAPERILELLFGFRDECANIYARSGDFKAEAIRTRLREAQERAEMELNTIAREVERAAPRAKELANTLAVSVEFSPELQDGLSRARLLLDFTADDTLAASIWRAHTAFQRDTSLLLAAWCFVADWLDVRPDWKATETAWRGLEELLPETYRARIRLAQEIADGASRVQQSLAAAYRYVRSGAQSRQAILRWGGEMVTLEPGK